MKTLTLYILFVATYSISFAVPRVAVLPFDPLMDSTYDAWGDQVTVLNYRRALQEFLISELGQSDRISVIELSTRVKSLSEAIDAARSVNADFAVIGTYAELPTGIRADARLVDVALGDVPLGYQASASAGRWADLSDVARELAAQLSGLLDTSSSTRRESKSRLVFEGERASLGYPEDSFARLIIEVNSPAPKIELGGENRLKRCSVKDRSLNDGTRPTLSCYSADVEPGRLDVKVEQRGYYGHTETLNLAAGKVYRLMVELEKMAFQTVPAAK